MWYNSFILSIYFITNSIMNVSFQTFKGVAVSCHSGRGRAGITSGVVSSFDLFSPVPGKRYC